MKDDPDIIAIRSRQLDKRLGVEDLAWLVGEVMMKHEREAGPATLCALTARRALEAFLVEGGTGAIYSEERSRWEAYLNAIDVDIPLFSIDALLDDICGSERCEAETRALVSMLRRHADRIETEIP